MTRHQIVIRWLAIALATTLGATTALYAAEQQQLVVYHWWTAGGERQAMQVIFDAFTKKNSSFRSRSCSPPYTSLTHAPA